MSDWTADSPPPCPRCGAQLRNRAWPEPGIRRQGCMTDGCYCEIESPLSSQLTVATAPWTRDLWAEVERVTAERDAYKRAKAENDERFMIERDEARRDRDVAAAKERAAVVAWLRLGCAWGVLDDYTPDQAANSIEAGDHLDATRA